MENVSSQEQVVLLVSISEYLDKLKVQEHSKPLNQQRSVPSLATLARLTGVPRATLYNLAGRKYDSVNLSHLSAVMNTLRQEGFRVTIGDLLTEHPVSTLPVEGG